LNIVFSRDSIVPRLMSHTVLEFLSTMKTRVRDSRARICSSPSFVNRMFTVVYPVIAIWSALDSLLIVLVSVTDQRSQSSTTAARYSTFYLGLGRQELYA
jgi:hypothetical protein